MAFLSLRQFIDIVEGRKAPKDFGRKPWGVSVTDLFAPSLLHHRKTYADLDEKVAKFIEVKKENPFQSRYGKHDYAFTGPLVGFWHCHLRDDAILIYNLADHAINLICIVSHSEIEGKRAVKTGKKIARFRS